MLVVPEAVIIQILEDYGCDLDFAINQCLDAVGDEEVDRGLVAAAEILGYIKFLLQTSCAGSFSL